MCDASDVTSFRVRFEGPVALVVDVATALAEAEGVELTSSDQPITVDEGVVALDLTVEGAFDAVSVAVAGIREGLPAEASIDVAGG